MIISVNNGQWSTNQLSKQSDLTKFIVYPRCQHRPVESLDAGGPPPLQRGVVLLLLLGLDHHLVQVVHLRGDPLQQHAAVRRIAMKNREMCCPLMKCCSTVDQMCVEFNTCFAFICNIFAPLLLDVLQQTSLESFRKY